MADEAEDVLELEVEDIEATEPEVEADTDEDSEDEETFISFDGEDEDEAAPASETESSVIREMRRKLREAERELKTVREGKAQKPAIIDPGPKPTLESCEYDEERRDREYDEWKERVAKAEAQKREADEQAEREQAEWSQRAEAYKASKATLAVSGYDEAEAEVFAAIPSEVQALILRQPERAPALVYALSRNPAKLEELSKLNLADAAMLVGELRAKVKMEKRRKLPDPDKPVNGRSGTPSTANLERLRDKARKSGDWDSYFAAKRAAQT